MGKQGSLVERVVQRYRDGRRGGRRKLVPVDDRSSDEPAAPRDQPSPEQVDAHDESGWADDTEVAAGRYAGGRRVSTDYIPPTHRYRTGPQPARAIPEDETPEYIEYWRAIMLRKWSILALALAGAIAAAAAVWKMPPVYRSSATLLIETDIAKLVPIGNPAGGVGAYYREYFQTQAEVLRSRDIAKRVVDRLNLAEHPEFDPRQTKPSPVQAWFDAQRSALVATVNAWADAVLPPSSTPAPTPTAAREGAALEGDVLRKYAERLSVTPVRQSQLIKVSFDAHDPALAAAVANATAQAYIQSDFESRSTVQQSAGQQINERLAELRATLNASEHALQAYRDREGMLDNKSTVLGGTVRQLDELTQKLVEARVRRSEAEQAYNQVKAGEATQYESVPAVVKSASVQRSREVEAEAEKKLAEVSQRYGPDHPRYAAAISDLNTARASTRRQIQNLVASVVKDYEAARATEKSIEAELGQAKSAIQTLNRKEIQLGALEREAATNRQIYQAFLSRAKETSATKDVKVSTARLVEEAVPALQPVRPAKTFAVLVTGGVCLLLGLIGAVILYRLNNTLQTSNDVERKLGRPLLAALPTLGYRQRRIRGQLMLDNPHGLYAEAIRVASTGMLLSALNKRHKVVAVTSAVLDEGKSTFAINLAHAQAASKQVLLVEGDMRRPSFDRVMRLAKGQKGLADVLSGTHSLEECLTQVDGTGLHVIPAGRVPSNPQELLVSPAFGDLLETLRSRYDTIIVDCPPVQLVADALIVGAHSTGLIFVVRANHTPVQMARIALRRIASANIPIFGVVLNRQDVKKAEKYYGEYSGYGKYWYQDGHRKKA